MAHTYTYEPIPGLFKVTTWEENVSAGELVVDACRAKAG